MVSWAAQCNAWLLIKLTPKGIVFSFLFFFFSTDMILSLGDTSVTPCLCCRYITVPVFDDASYDQIEAEVLQFFNMSEIVTPDEVRGNYSTLSDAVLTNSRYASSASHCCRKAKNRVHLSHQSREKPGVIPGCTGSHCCMSGSSEALQYALQWSATASIRLCCLLLLLGSKRHCKLFSCKLSRSVFCPSFHAQIFVHGQKLS